jgi:uncharacterized protein YkwD
MGRVAGIRENPPTYPRHCEIVFSSLIVTKPDSGSSLTSVNRRAVVLALTAFVTVLAPATASHAGGFNYAFATLPRVTAATMTDASDRSASITRLQHRRARIVELTNAQRSAGRLGTLTVSAQLQKSAQHYVNHLAADGAFSHTDGSMLSTRVSAAGYAYQVVGENLAIGQTSPVAVVAAWMASAEHRANMLDHRFTQMGVGVAERGDGRLVWCIDFGWPKA